MGRIHSTFPYVLASKRAGREVIVGGKASVYLRLEKKLRSSLDFVYCIIVVFVEVVRGRRSLLWIKWGPYQERTPYIIPEHVPNKR